MHDAGDGADDTPGVVDESDELSEGGAAAEIDDAAKSGMVMGGIADLGEEQASGEVIHDGLVTGGIPPLDGVIELAAGDDDPEGEIVAGAASDLGGQGLFVGGEMDIAVGEGDGAGDVEMPGEEFGETVEAMDGPAIAFVDERILAIDDFDAALAFAEGGEVGVVLPEVRTGGPDVGEEGPRVGAMKVPHRRREHDDVPRRPVVAQDEAAGRCGEGRGHPSLGHGSEA